MALVTLVSESFTNDSRPILQMKKPSPAEVKASVFQRCFSLGRLHALGADVPQAGHPKVKAAQLSGSRLKTLAAAVPMLPLGASPLPVLCLKNKVSPPSLCSQP